MESENACERKMILSKFFETRISEAGSSCAKEERLKSIFLKASDDGGDSFFYGMPVWSEKGIIIQVEYDENLRDTKLLPQSDYLRPDFHELVSFKIL